MDTARTIVNKIVSNTLRIDYLQREIRESNKVAESGIWPTRVFYENHQIIVELHQQQINSLKTANDSLIDRLELKRD